jgi:hypothetical protein
MSKIMRKYVTLCDICQQLFYEIVSTNENYHKNLMNLIYRFHRVSVIVAYFCRRVNDFRGFHACNSGISTGRMGMSGAWAANRFFDALSGSKHPSSFWYGVESRQQI